MFRAGSSAPGAEEPMLQLETNMRDIGDLRNVHFSMGGRTIPAPVMTSRTLGVSISDEVLENYDFSPVGEDAAAHAETIRPNQSRALRAMLRHEGIPILDSDQINKLLVFKESTLTEGSEAYILNTGFHELGHAVSTATTPDRFVNVDAFRRHLEHKPVSLNAKSMAERPLANALEFRSKFIAAMGDYGLEEARAESFTSLMSRTRIGQEMYGEILRGRGGESLLTGYHILSYEGIENARLPFSSYLEYLLELTEDSPHTEFQYILDRKEGAEILETAISRVS